jgi:hypothetical protein
MPHDPWQAARSKDKAKGRSAQTDREYEENYDAAINQWIARHESQGGAVAQAPKRFKRKKRKRRR